MSRSVDLPSLETVRAPSAADQIFAALYRQVVTLELPPGSRLSEAEVARRMGVSRQPVRDAFWRLSQLGFLTIRPQRATTVSPISERSVEQARFIRTALEVETVRLAVERRDEAALAALAAPARGAGRRRWRPTTASGSTASTTTSTGCSATLAGHGLRLVADPREQGAHGPGALHQPRASAPSRRWPTTG